MQPGIADQEQQTPSARACAGDKSAHNSPVNLLVQEIAATCSELGLQHVVVLGSNVALEAALGLAGLEVFCCKLGSSRTEKIHLDLLGPIDGAKCLVETIAAHTLDDPWLVVCVDVLEFLDMQDLGLAVRSVRALCPVNKGYLFASLGNQVDDINDRCHASILPKHAWRELFQLAGFAIKKNVTLRLTEPRIRQVCETDDAKLASYWSRSNLFADSSRHEFHHAVFSPKSDPDAAGEELPHLIDGVLDVTYKAAKAAIVRNELANIPKRADRMCRVGFNLHHIQEFLLYRPILDALPAESVTVLVRTSVLDPDALSMARVFFARRGIQAIAYTKCTEIAWRELNLDVLITGVESNATGHHIMGRQVVEAAKLHGVQTIQMQHGIWIEQFPQRLVEFGSETIWAWNSQYERFVRESEVELAGSAVRAHNQEWQKFTIVGSPRFVDMQVPPPRNLLRWRLGLDATKYRAVALLGTNLYWHHHGVPAKATRERLVQMMRSTSDVLFVVKLHPTERAFDAAELKMPNSLVLDDILMGMLDLQISRLIAAADVVISSLSTLLLDAAAAGKPCVQYNTGNDLAYEGQASVEIEQLPKLLMNIDAIPVNQQLLREYASPDADPFYHHLARTLADATSRGAACERIRKDAASYYSVATEVERLWEQVRGTAQQFSWAQGQVNALTAENSRVASENHTLQNQLRLELEKGQAAEAVGSARVEALRAELEALGAELEAYRKSSSWRVTAPLRLAGRLLRG